MEYARHDEGSGDRRSGNLRTAVVLGSIALAFFIGVILKYVMFQ